MDPQSVKHWNKEVLNFEIIKISPDDLSCVIHEKKKPHGFLYKSRDFFYRRSVFVINNNNNLNTSHNNFATYYIVDKNVNYDMTGGMAFDGTIGTVGLIHLQITAVSVHPSNPRLTLLAVDTEISNCGFINWDQDTLITKKYLQCYYNLENYLLQKSFAL